MPETRWLDETQKQAWLALLVFINRGMPQLERTLKEQGLLGVHYSIFVALSEARDATMRLSELADGANLSQSRLTHRLKTMIERGHVEITDDTEDGRAKHATLTPAGRRFLEQVAPIHAEDVQRMVFDPLDEAETEALAHAMSKIARTLCDHEIFQPHRL
ncbi:MAG: MarR family winged helix-turn-helix transcriptional regulator [Acidimicrobiales bacterium]